jgi:hypothetical protein
MVDPITIISLSASIVTLLVVIGRIVHDKVITSSCVLKDESDAKAEELTKQMNIMRDMNNITDLP